MNTPSIETHKKIRVIYSAKKCERKERLLRGLGGEELRIVEINHSDCLSKYIKTFNEDGLAVDFIDLNQALEGWERPRINGELDTKTIIRLYYTVLSVASFGALAIFIIMARNILVL